MPKRGKVAPSVPVFSPRAVWALAGGVALVHFALALAFAWVTPYRTAGILIHQNGAFAADISAPDERQHANYVSQLVQGEGFPVFRPRSEDLYETYQSHQPPAYYVVAAGWAKATGAQDVEDRGFGFRLRALSGMLGAVAVLGVFAFVIWGFGRPIAALCAAAFAALLPMNVALSGAISNDPMLFAVCSWTLALLARSLRQGYSARSWIGIGALLGLGLLTKTSAIALFVPALVAAWWVSGRKVQVFALRAALVVGLALAIVAPWWLRNTQLYGDPLALKAFSEAFVGTAQASVFVDAFGAYGYWTQWVGWWTLRSSIGAFGYMDIFLPNMLYGGFAIAILLLLGKGIAGNGEPLDPAARASVWMAVGFSAVVLLMFVRFNLQYFQGQARYLFPAMAPFAAWVGLGAESLLGSKRWAPFVLAAALASLCAYVLVLLPGEFRRRESLSPNVLQYVKPKSALDLRTVLPVRALGDTWIC